MSRNSLLCPIALALTVLSASFAGAEEQRERLLTKIKNAWATREKMASNGVFSWKQTVTRPRGSLASQSRPNPLNPKGLTIPETDTTYDSHCDLRFAGSKLHYGYEGKTWNSETGDVCPIQYIGVFDGKEMRIFYPKGAEPFLSGVIRQKSKSMDLMNIHPRPILLAYRALTGQHGLHLDDYDVTSDDVQLHGRSCVVLTQRQKPMRGKPVTTLWIEKDKGFPIRRELKLNSLDGSLVRQLDVWYEDEADVAVPTRWEGRVAGSDGSLREYFHAHTNLAQLNVPGLEGQIRLDFPLGTLVVDDKNDEFFIVTPEGKRLITMQERAAGLTYERLLATESGQGLSATKPSWFSILVCFIGVFGLGPIPFNGS